MAKYKWLKTNQTLRRTLDGACIPWPPVESEGFKAKVEIDAGELVDPEDPPIPPDPRLVLDETERQAAKIDNALMALVNSTPAQLQTFVNNNFPSLATQGEKNRLATILGILAVAVRPHVRL
jgi:hypothetical protein